MTGPAYVPDDAEDITDHGASPNPEDPSLGAADRNLTAILDAAASAGANGSIYVPEGTFYIGTEDLATWTSFGGRDPPGISIYGAGPERSVVGATEHASNSQNYNLFLWKDGDHGTVTLRGFQIDGNGENLPNLYQGNSGSNAVQLEGSGTVAAEELYIHDTYDAGIWCKNDGGTIERCTFEQIAIRRENDAAAGGDKRTDHATKAHHTDGEWLKIDQCKFETIAGTCINQDFGNVELTRSYANGYGVQVNKLSRGTFRVTNTFIRANTPEQEEAVANDGPDGFIGRFGAFRKFDDPGQTPTVELNHVEIRDTAGAAMVVVDGPKGSDNVALESCDMIAIHNAGFTDQGGRYGSVIYTKDHDLTNVDIDTMSVHDSGGEVFHASGSDGAVRTLSRDGTDGLGDPGGIDVGSDNAGGAPLEPDVPSADEAGHDAGKQSSEPDEESDASDSPLFEEWTPRWASETADWSVVSGDEYAGEHALAFAPDGSERSQNALSWDSVGERADVEVFDRFRVPSFADGDGAGNHARVHVRSSTGDAGPEGYWVEIKASRDCFRLGKYTDGEAISLEQFGTPSENTFYSRRFQAVGERLRVKVWPATESEPSAWDVELTDGDHAEGWVGVGSYDSEPVEIDVFSVGTDGESAPSDGGVEGESSGGSGGSETDSSGGSGESETDSSGGSSGSETGSSGGSSGSETGSSGESDEPDGQEGPSQSSDGDASDSEDERVCGA